MRSTGRASWGSCPELLSREGGIGLKKKKWVISRKSSFRAIALAQRRMADGAAIEGEKRMFDRIWKFGLIGGLLAGVPLSIIVITKSTGSRRKTAGTATTPATP